MKLEVVTISESQRVQNDIIGKIRDLINYKNLEPGDKLPAERTLSEKFEVTRSNVRDAIQKLEFYGLLKSIPQSGTFVANIGVIAMNGMIDDILRLESSDFKSLVETRILLELKTVRLASLRRTEEDLENIKEALDAYKEKALSGEDAVQEDLLFHLAIAKASGNSTINMFMLTITPQIIIDFGKYHVCNIDQAVVGIQEHNDIYDAIKKQDPVLAKQKMKDHFKILYQYCYKVE
ncbi:FadR/GntR family transcriptional regulator [Algibacter lectus]|uniref:Transcriptional regulator n=1 Tax=Algibacter lectus TaxID=221126 RepID=A0A090WR40_9FLAO|nr:FadR/GntR family transcriptional regulator [Algibacter lectus]MDO7136781.1 FadR/GntR family transcriptional regulator [Algibacter lectus]MWW24745.1 FCD domain-containing protein [Algibacter lectus]TDY62766.1 GntR family transcriptional regulator [Algibacter lectus]SFC90641.1 transcriptional regulator, GntR family [Algibacter lectus]GAL62921.1 transcriptional regulator [Algibacter lectus]